MVKWITAAILLLPVAEIATFVLVAMLIGFGWAVALTAATTIAGFFVLRQAGRGRLARFRATIAANDVAGIEANTSGFLDVLAGILLFLPGFLTDLAGALLLIGPVRRRCAAALHRIMMGPDRGGRRDEVIDLAPDQWTQMPDNDPPRRGNDRGG